MRLPLKVSLSLRGIVLLGFLAQLTLGQGRVVPLNNPDDWKQNSLIIGDLADGHRGRHYNDAEGFFAATYKFHEGHQKAVALQHETQGRAMAAQATCPTFCGHGKCAPAQGICICDMESAKGFWAGLDCNECSSGWAGADCKIECPGGSCNPCNKHGTCSEGVSGDGTCKCTGNWGGVECSECKTNFFGPNCDQECPGTGSDGSVCYGRGRCTSDSSGGGKCICTGGWGSASGCAECDVSHYGDECLRKCVGYVVSTAQPCSGHGVCFNGTTGNGTCICEVGSGYGGSDCSKRCPNMCSTHGYCNEGAENAADCNCTDNWAKPDCATCVIGKTGNACQYPCPVNPTTGEICSLAGNCTFDPTATPLFTPAPAVNGSTPAPLALGAPVCRCVPGYTGKFCEISCGGNPPCSGHGLCVNNATGPVCQCYNTDALGHWTGPTCNVCDIKYNQSANCSVLCPVAVGSGKVCNDRGICAEGYCYCIRNDPVTGRDYCGRACEESSPATANNDPLDPTSCTGTIWPSFCPYPFGILTNKADLNAPCNGQCPGYHDQGGVQYACEGHGYCGEGRQGSGVCQCMQDWVGADCKQSCPSTPATSLVCSGIGRGRCSTYLDTFGVAKPFCDCLPQFAGLYCQLDCPTVAGQICSGHGNCFNTYVGNATCNCTKEWTGRACGVPCACNTDFGTCDAVACRANLATNKCEVCKCTGNFSAVGLCDTCVNGTQGELCDGECINGYTRGRICVCNKYYATASCSVRCPEWNGTICGGHGTCIDGSSNDGHCSCDTGSNGLFTEWFLPNCTKQCTRDACRLRGFVNPQCNNLGECECLNDNSQHWATLTAVRDGDPQCTECVPGYWGQTCSQVCPCNDHGSCDKLTSNDCTCYANTDDGFWTGTRCDVCDAGFIGTRCEQKNIVITQVDDKQERGSTVSGLLLTAGPQDLPSPRLLAVDYQKRILYAGSWPGFQINVSGFDMSTIGSTLDSREFQCGNVSGETFFVSIQLDETATTTQDTYNYFLQQPISSAECNASVRIVAVNRTSNSLANATVLWRCTPAEIPICTSTARIVAAVDKRSAAPTYVKIITFVISETRTVNGIRTLLPGGYVVRYDLEAKKVVSYTISSTSVVKAISIAPDTPLSSLGDERYVLGGSLIESGTKWDAFVLGVTLSNSSGAAKEVQAFQYLFSLRDSDRVPCWSLTDGTPDSAKCDTCTSATRVFWNATSIIAALDGREPTRTTLAWFIPIARATTFEGQSVVGLFDSRCVALTARFTGSAGLVLVDDKSQQQVNPLAYLKQQYYVKVAPTNVDQAVVESVAYDEAAAVTYICVSVAGRPSVFMKIRNDLTAFRVYGRSKDLGFVTAGQNVYPKTFSQLAIDPTARLIYGVVEKSINLRIETFLLYEISQVTPTVVDQREGTIVTIEGSGFSPVPLNAWAQPGSWFSYPVVCRFGDIGSYRYMPANVSFKSITCVASRADNDTSSAESCGGQPVEVSLYGYRWFTQNGETIKRVPSPRILPPVSPQRGPLQNGPTVTVFGTGFVDSPSAVCTFYSNNTLARNVPVLRAPARYVSPTQITCNQPDSSIPSYDPSLLDYLTDGQQTTESGPAIYQIVGPAVSLASPPTVVVQARQNTTFSIEVVVVDVRGHERRNLDTERRQVELIANGTVSLCDPAAFSAWMPYLQGNYTYPTDPCRNLYVNLVGPSLRLSGNGSILYNDLFLIRPRKGTVLAVFIPPGLNDWATTTIIRVVEGAAVALMIANFGDLLRLDASESTKTGFAKGAALNLVEVIVIDELANIVDSPGDIFVTAQPFEVVDATNETIYGQKVIAQHREENGNKIPFGNLFLPFIHGVAHFINFTSGTLRPVLSPPLRTSLCDIKEYKVPMSGDCKPCPSVGARCNGTETIVILDGFWRGNTTTEIYECDDPGVCLLAAAGSLCRQGHTGPLCSQCIAGWGKAGKTCTECPNPTEAIATVALGALGFVAALLIWTVMTLRKAEVTDISVLMRTVVNHMQATGKLGEFSTQWGPLAKRIFAIQSAGSDVSISGLASVDCLLKSNNMDYSAVFAVYMCLPVLSVSMAFLVFIVVRLMKLKPVITKKLQDEVEEEVRNVPNAKIGQLLHSYPFYMVFVTTFCVHMFAMYQTFITQATAVLKCKDLIVAREMVNGQLVDIHRKYLAVDMSIPCDQNDNHKFRTPALLCAIGYGVGVPLLFVAGYLLVNSRLSKKELTKLMFMFLIGGYKDSFWFWQAIIMIRKLFLVLIIVFIETNKVLQAYMGMWSMSLALIVQIVFKPNIASDHNVVEAISLAIITITLNLGLLYLWDGTQGDDNQNTRDVLTGVLATITIFAMLMFAYFMITPLKTMVEVQLKELKRKYKAFREGKPLDEDAQKEEDGKKKKGRLIIVDPIRDRLHGLDEYDDSAEMDVMATTSTTRRTRFREAAPEAQEPEFLEVDVQPAQEFGGPGGYSSSSGGGRQSTYQPSRFEEMQPQQRFRAPSVTLNKSSLVGQFDTTAGGITPPRTVRLTIIDSNPQGGVEPPKRPRFIGDDAFFEEEISAPTPSRHVPMKQLTPSSNGRGDVSQSAFGHAEFESYSPASAPPVPMQMSAHRNRPMDEDLL